MEYYVGLDVSLKSTHICIMDHDRQVVWRGSADAQALAEMLASGWYSAVHVKTMESHRLKALLGAREQLANVKRQLYRQVRGLLRPFGIKISAERTATDKGDACAIGVGSRSSLTSCGTRAGRTAT
ncbi:hypothetical protein PZN02_006054 (plasmid) [Sinorhizobium garamanticum]|uniref:Transposase n=1 Tax=Sinorhizobium garamanticum TaxID=680247 RepID=A0ABY8DLH3_9HYPH|nr:hypothetical protein [Sinorhizobium garamanticum]WEX91741.1 hypothetical protein PZN02_006054 [Sinorhizobium garamanticum]